MTFQFTHKYAIIIDTMKYKCFTCDKEFSVQDRIFRCSCGGFLALEGSEPFPLDQLSRRDQSIWRYREAFALPPGTEPVSLGEGRTPLLKRKIDGNSLAFKLDFMQPTGAFKDRGASVLISLLKNIGVFSIVEDSSGNAGAALSAYSASAGIKCTIFAPDYTPAGKLVQITAYGAEVVKVAGKRQDANDAAVKAAETSFYASHLWNPYFIMGHQSLAFELWEEFDRDIPSMIVAPLGSGGLLEGLFQGFKSLKRWGFASRMPRLIGVQSEKCSPLHTAFVQNLDDFAAIETGSTIADGISVQRPPRAKAVLSAIRETGGETLTVTDQEIISAGVYLSSKGLFVEPTSATVFAGWLKLKYEEREGAVLILTGSGLKETVKLAAILKNSSSRQ